jgi:ABC-2 type transport system permease protein
LNRSLSLLWHQLKFSQKVFWRNPGSVFFTVLLPVLLLVIFATIFGTDPIESLGGIPTTDYYVPAIASLAVVSATFLNLGMNLTIAREAGLLKRLRGTPQPAWLFIAGKVANAVIISALMVVLITAVGAALYGSPPPWDGLAALVVSLAVGAACFCCLGIAMTAVIPSREAAPAVMNLITLPLYFLSGVFIPESEIPEGVLRFAGLFPIRSLFEAFLSAYDPAVAGFAVGPLVALALWGTAGFLLAARFFRWTPSR